MAIAATIPPTIIKEIPENNFFLTPSCILGAINPATETLIGRIYDLLGLRWTAAGDRLDSQCTCCTGILSHGDVISMESTLLVVARLWSIAAELGFDNITTACVTSFAIHTECLEMYHHEPGLYGRVDRWLRHACGRHLRIPKHVVHASDIVYHYRDALAQKLRYRLVDHRTGRPLRIVDHVGCHYAKVFPEKAVGGAESCEVLTGPIRAWGGETVDYPERRHCCGMGFRQCMIRPNRGYTMACVLKKLDSMEPWDPDAILTNCPGCNVLLDKEQWAIEQMCGKAFNIPTLSYTELAGLLLGWDPYDVVGIQAHTVPVEPLLDKIGIPYDKSKEWLAKENLEVA
jgi:heterodisulfide reductase subunit B